MSNYYRNKARTATKSVQETLTDQSQVHNTDRNIVVSRFLSTGQAPGSGKQPMYGDFRNLPRSLAGFIHQARELEKLRHKLPKELKNKSMKELMEMDANELTRILTPPAPTPAVEKPEEKK